MSDAMQNVIISLITALLTSGLTAYVVSTKIIIKETKKIKNSQNIKGDNNTNTFSAKQ